ncbi:interleukin-like EMT inducer domain-containing protein, partial [Clostridium perfringens]
RKTDSTTDYGLLIRGKDGKTIMLDSDGVHNAGITNGAIDNNKVADNANISGNKLDINSVIREVNNNGTETIKGTKVTVGDRTLDVELTTQNNTITEHSKELSSQKASLTALDNALKFKVDSQTFTQSTTTINNNINRAKEEAINTANSNTTNAINSLEIGGRNLVLDSLVNESSSNYEFAIREVKGLEPNTEYIFSANGFIKSNNEKKSLVVYIYPPDWSWSYNFNLPYDNAETRFIKFRTPNEIKKGIVVRACCAPNSQAVDKNLATLNWYKVEKGNKLPTDWTPAPEDLKAYSDDVAKAKADLAQANAIANADGKITTEEQKRIQQAQENLNIAISKADKAKQDAILEANRIAELKKQEAINSSNSHADSKANEALNNAKAFVNSEITNVNTHLNKNTSEINILKGQIESKVSQSDIDKSIQNIKFNDVNMILNSGEFKDTDHWSCTNGSNNLTIENRILKFKFTNYASWGCYISNNSLLNKPLDISKKYTVVCKLKASKNQILTFNICDGNSYNYVFGKELSLTTEWQIFKFTFNPTQVGNERQFRFITSNLGYDFDLYIEFVKMVEGATSSDSWSMAPDYVLDNIKTVTDKISIVESKLTQENNSIKASVQDLNSITQTITTSVSNLNRDLTSKINSNLDASKNFATDIATNKANTAKQEAISSANSHADNIAASKATEAINSAKAYTNAEITTVNSKVHNVESNLNILSDRINTKVSQSDIDKAVTTIRTERIIYARGTGNDYPANSIVKVNGKTITDGQGRGLRINALNKSTLERVFLQDYDTFGSEDAKVSFVNKINELNNGDFIIIITSQDASYPLHQPIKEALEKIGATLFDNKQGTYREAYALIGKSKLGRGNGVEMFIPRTANDKRFAEVSVKVGEDGNFIGVNPNNMGLEATLIKSNISDVSSSVTQLRDSVTTDIRAINSKTQSIETTLNGKASKQEVTEVNNRVATIKASLDGITQRVSATESKTQTLEININGKASKEEIVSINSKVASIETSLSGITNRVSSTESKTSS